MKTGAGGTTECGVSHRATENERVNHEGHDGHGYERGIWVTDQPTTGNPKSKIQNPVRVTANSEERMMRGANRVILAAAGLAVAAGCSQRSHVVKAYEGIEVGQTTRAQVDRLLPDGPVRPGQVETFVGRNGDRHVRLRYSHNAPQGVVMAKHLFTATERKGERYRTLTLRREGVVRPKDPRPYRRAVRDKDIDPLIDLLAPKAGTLTAVLNETPYVNPEFGSVVSIRDEFRPDAPDPPAGQRHLPEVFIYTQRGRIDDFDQSHRGFGRWTLLTSTGDWHSAFFVPGQVYPGSHAYRSAAVDGSGFLTFSFHFENYGETVDTIVAVKEDPTGTFHVRYETTAVLVRKP